MSKHCNFSSDHKRVERLRRERPSTRKQTSTRTYPQEHAGKYDYREDQLILHNLLEELRQKYPWISILRVSHYPLYSHRVKIYRLDSNKIFRRPSNE